jgi:hypothetical protein
MSGGIGRIRLDAAQDYRKLRRDRYGIDKAPLRFNLQLSPSDAEMNRRVNHG